MQAVASAATDEPIQPRPTISKSFSRYEPDHSDPLLEAKTFQEGTNADLKEGQAQSLLSRALLAARNGDVFESREAREDEDPMEHADGTPVKLPETFDELPIEIRSLTDRFLDSLSAKVHPTPPSVDALSELFQAFYTRADAAISTHIAALSSRISREASPARGVGDSSDLSKNRSRSNSGAKQAATEQGEQQMLTPLEINNRRKARRLLELKRSALEEAVERGVCERLYDRLWRHRSTDDEERDSKLRSKTAALAVVGIGLKELHVDTDGSKGEAREIAANKKEEIDASLAAAREDILKMNQERYPLGKLKHLTAAHKSIVETLSQLFPSSSSADEVLPTLIYTLITTPAESINAVSNLYFIQRFRATNKMDGEASYCLVNLEAAISFLETVDLSSLRADEVPEGPPKASRAPSFSSLPEKSPPVPAATATHGSKFETSPTSIIPINPRVRADKSPTPSSSSRSSNPQERINSLIKRADSRIEAGRESFLSSADSAFDTINTTLNDSFKFVFGRLKEQQQHEREIRKQHATIRQDPEDSEPKAASNSRSPTIIPETLEDARKLVNPPSSPPDDDVASETNRDATSATTLEREKALFTDPLNATGSTTSTKPTDSKLLDLLAGHPRDRSADSANSSSSLDAAKKRVAFASTSSGATVPPAQATASAISASPPTATGAIESVRSLGTSLNPLNRFGGIGFRGFGRQQATPPSQTPSVLASPKAEEEGKMLGGGDAAAEGETTVSKNAAGELKRMLPAPKRRFVEMRDTRELKIGEVEELLREYQQLVAGVQKVISSG